MCDERRDLLKFFLVVVVIVAIVVMQCIYTITGGASEVVGATAFSVIGGVAGYIIRSLWNKRR